MHYRRAYVPGGTFFFTLNLNDRSSTLLTDQIHLLRDSMRQVIIRHPVKILAMVILPDHLHAVWSLPPDDDDYSLRWSLIKSGFSRALPRTEFVSSSRSRKRERGIWQRRFWEHLIRDDQDLENHVDYVHINPVKHGYVMVAADWQYSTIHRYIKTGDLSADWAVQTEIHEPNFGEVV